MSTPPILGGWRPAQLPNENVKAITALMKPVVESTGTDAAAIKEFKAVMYTSQIVAGTNYIIKVLVNPAIDEGCFHLHIYQPLPSKDAPVSYQLTKVVKKQTLDEPIVPLTVIHPPTPPNLPGGLSAARLADAEVEAISFQIRHAVEASTGVRYKEFKPIMYKTQVVAGLNYFIKIQVDPFVADSCIQITVFRALPTKELQLAYQLSQVQPAVLLDSRIVSETKVRPPPCS